MLVTYIAVAIATVMLIKYIKQQLAYRRLFHDMPGSKDFRYTTGTFHLVPGANERGIAFLCDLARQYCYFHRGWIGPLSPAIFVYHPESIRPILRSQAPKPRSLILSSIYDMGTPLVGEGLLTANGSKWARSRRLLTPAFHFDILKPYVDVYNICTDTLLDKLRSLSAQGESFEVFSTLSLTALDIIQRCVFSYQSNCQTTEKPQLHCNLLYSISSEGRKLRKLCAIAHKVSDDIIEKRRKELQMSQTITAKTLQHRLWTVDPVY